MTTEEAQERVRARQLARLGALFAGFAHEIRNPLSTIGLNLQLVKEDFGSAESPRDRRIVRRLSVIESEVKRLQSILDQFLGYVRIPRLDRKPIPLNQLLAEQVDFALPEMQEKGVSLRFFGDSSVAAVSLDADKFRAVVVNLLRNALDACSDGDEVMVATRAEPGGAVTVRVTDTGSGMVPEVLQKVFTPYFSTKKSGTGLGLPTARRLIELHGGTLEADSEPGRGSQFTIRVPTPVTEPLPEGERP